VSLAYPLELFEGRSLLGRELRGNLDDDLKEEVPASEAPEVRHPLPLQSKDVPVLGSRRYLERGGAVQGGNSDLGAEGGLREGERKLGQEIVTVAGEQIVLLDRDHDVKITRCPAPKTGLALSLETNLGTVLNPGGNSDLEEVLAFDPSLAPAFLARALHERPLPAALRARPSDR